MLMAVWRPHLSPSCPPTWGSHYPFHAPNSLGTSYGHSHFTHEHTGLQETAPARKWSAKALRQEGQMCRSGLSGFQLNWVAAGFRSRHEEVGGRP